MRQADLVQRIRQAQGQGLELEEERLRSQLVHRFGVGALKLLDASAEPSQVVAMHAERNELEDQAEPVGWLERVNATLRSSRGPTPAASAPVGSSSVSAPPISTPRSLRRWLPGQDASIDRLAS
ncbi:MAG: hypothetical protein ACPG6X_00905 [Synechococcus sp.]